MTVRIRRSSSTIAEAPTQNAPWRKRPSVLLLWLPCIGAVSWLLVTLSLFVAGPYSWTDQSTDRVTVYVSLFAVLFTGGYAFGIRKKSQPPPRERVPRNVLMLSAAVVLLPLIVSVLSGDLIRALMLARTDLSLAYVAWARASGTSFWPYFEMITAPLAAFFLPVSVFYWKRLSFMYRLAFLVAIAILLLGAAASGRRSGVVYVAMVIVTAVAARAAGSPRRLRKKAMKRFGVIAVLGLLLLVPFLHYVASNRSRGADLRVNPITREFPDPEHVFSRRIPEAYAPTLFSAVFYVSHGYYGLAKALDQPFEGVTAGLGASWFIRRNAERLGVSPSFVEAAYDLRLTNEGYPVGLWWMTIFPWYASDVTFPGTLLLGFFFGFGLARAWERSSVRGSPWFIVLLTILVHLAFSMPMSNPLQDGSGVARLLGVMVFCWISSLRPRPSHVRRVPASSLESPA